MALAPSKKPKNKAISDDLQQAIRAAAQWHVQLNANNTCASLQAEQQIEWQTWLNECRHHKLAWQQIERLMGKFINFLTIYQDKYYSKVNYHVVSY